jgi:hypothetical protein
MDFFCYLKDNCCCHSNNNIDSHICFGYDYDLHECCGDYDEEGNLWCFSCCTYGRYKVGRLLTKNCEDYVEENVYGFSPIPPPAVSGYAEYASSAVTASKIVSHTGVDIAAEAEAGETTAVHVDIAAEAEITAVHVGSEVDIAAEADTGETTAVHVYIAA